MAEEDGSNGGERHPDVFEVTTGKHVDADGREIGPGGTFHPTRRQVESGSLAGKARRVREDTSVSFSGADIGIRALEWGSDVALKRAVQNDVTVEELKATGGPSGETGWVTADVNAALDAREESEPEGEEEGDGDGEEEEEGEEDGEEEDAEEE